MKNRPLALQIWLVFAGITLGISLLFMILVPWTLRDFFTRQMYNTILESQELYLANGQLVEIKDMVKWDQRNQQYRSVKHMVFFSNGQVLSGYSSIMARQEFTAILGEALNQQEIEQQYSRKIENERMYYVIRKGEIAGQPAYLLSYMWESYQAELVNTLFTRLMWIIGVLLLLSWVPSFWLARYLTRPLTEMECHVRRIADRDWHQALECNRGDEIGMLGQSIERMRQCLVNQDEMQQKFLQHVSHELKTPVMVIRSYAQAIADGIFPRGGLEGSVKVIDEEAERLEKRIRQLLYLTKLDYLLNREKSYEPVYLSELIKHIVEHLRWQRPEIKWDLELEPVVFNGDSEQWQIAIENLLDNQIRYANSSIGVFIKQVSSEKSFIKIKICNDGPPIEPQLLDSLFKEYEKGYQGQFGLGLAIVQQIVSRHGAEVKAVNEDGGAAFYINIPV